MTSENTCRIVIKHDENAATAARRNPEVAEHLQSIQALQEHLKKRIGRVLPHEEFVNSYLNEQANLEESDGGIELTFNCDYSTEKLKEKYFKLLRSRQILDELERNRTESKNVVEVKERKEEGLITKLYHTIIHTVENCSDIPEQDLLNCLKSGNVTNHDDIKKRVEECRAEQGLQKTEDTTSETEEQWSALTKNQNYIKIIKKIQELDLESDKKEDDENKMLYKNFKEKLSSKEGPSTEMLSNLETQLKVSIPQGSENEFEKLVELKKAVKMMTFIIERSAPEAVKKERPSKTSNRSGATRAEKIQEIEKATGKLMKLMGILAITIAGALTTYGISKNTSDHTSKGRYGAKNQEDQKTKRKPSAREEAKAINKEMKNEMGGNSFEQEIRHIQKEMLKGKNPINSKQLRKKFELSRRMIDASQRIFPMGELKVHMSNAVMNKQVHHWKIYKSDVVDGVIFYHSNKSGEKINTIPNPETVTELELFKKVSSYYHKGKDVFILEKKQGKTFFARCSKTNEGFVIDIAKKYNRDKEKLITFSSYTASLSQDGKSIRLEAWDIHSTEEKEISCTRDLNNNDQLTASEVLEHIVKNDVFNKFNNPKY